MIPQRLLTTDEYLEIVFRRIWYIVIPLVLAMTGAASYAIFCPRTYLASTTIMVTPQKVPVDYIRPTVTTHIEDRLNAIGKQIMSRTELEKVISDFHLYEDESKTLAKEEIIELMQKNISLSIGANQGYFTLSYMGRDPVIVTKIANRLASLFVEENLRQREQQAQGTTEFLSQEMNATKAKLEEQEKVLTDYKQKHLYELPERSADNMSMLRQLREDQKRVSDALNANMERKLMIQQQIVQLQKQMELMKSLEEPAPNSATANQKVLPQSTSPTSAPPLSGMADHYDPVRVERLKGQLRDLKMKYTDKHPDVLFAQKAIKDLEKMDADAKKESDTKASSNKSAEDSDPQAAFIKEMKGQLALTGNEIQNLKKEESKIRAEIATYQARVEHAPVMDLMLTNLGRGYETAKENYKRLLDKSESAQQAENLEKRQKGEQFQLIDPARVPEKPIKPNIPKVLLAGLALGIFSGAGLMAIMEYMDRSFRDARDMEATLGIKVLANIPRFDPKSGNTSAQAS